MIGATPTGTTAFDFLVIAGNVPPRLAGGNALGRNNLNNLRIVLARSWESESKDAAVKLYTPPQVLTPFIEEGQTFAIAQYLGLVHGCDEKDLEGATDGLMDATALFQGLARPLAEDRSNDHFYVYVTSPPCSYAYRDLRDLRGIELPQPCPRPQRDGLPAVFVTYVNPFPQARAYEGQTDVHGLVSGWEWVPSDQAGLPIASKDRYPRRIW